MLSLEQITTDNVVTFKNVRLRALKDSPTAFGSTYAREAEFSNSEWLTRAANMNGDQKIGYLAMDNGAGCGIAAGFLDEQDSTRAHLVSMWVAPPYRRRGLGRLLVDAVKQWARRRGARTLQLMVTNCNARAIEFYEQIGFSMTGRMEPYPNDPTLIEYEMAASIRTAACDKRE